MKRVLILSQPLHNNYGGLLQAFALQKVVKSLGFDVVTNKAKLKPNREITFKKIIVFCYNKAKNIAKKILRYKTATSQNTQVISQNTKKFIDKFIDNQHIENLSDEIIEQFDIFIVGSDQVFRKRWSPVTKYFLEDLQDRNDKIKVAYAASFGTDDLSEWTEHDIKVCQKLTPKFRAISVREDSGVEIFKKYFNTNVQHVLDPTLLLEKEDYLKTIDKEDSSIKSNVLMCYVLDKTSEKMQIINKIKNKTGLDVLEIMPNENYTADTKDISKCIFPSVSKWLAGFRDAKFVVTDSFHGTVFSIIFQKPFIVIGNQMRGLSRMSSLLTIFGLKERLISTESELKESLFENIDYEKVNDIKIQWKNKSLDFLKNNLK